MSKIAKILVILVMILALGAGTVRRAYAFDWFQLLYNVGAFLMTRPQQRNESKPSADIQQRFEQEEELKGRYMWFPRDGVLHMTPAASNKEKLLPTHMGSTYRVFPEEYFGAYNDIIIDFPCGQGAIVNRVRVQITHADPTASLKKSDDEGKDETGKNTREFVVAISPQMDEKVSGSATIVIRRRFKRSTYPYFIKAWPEGRGFDAKSAAKLTVLARMPAEFYREYMAEKKHLIGEMAMDAYSEQTNSEYDKERDSTFTIEASADDKRGGKAWKNGPSHVVVVDFRRGRNIRRRVPLDHSGTTKVKVFSGRVVIGPEKGMAPFKINPNYILEVSSGQEGECLIYPDYVKPSFPIGLVEAVIQVSGRPGSKLPLRITSFRGNKVIDKKRVTVVVPSCGLKEFRMTERNAEGIRIEDLSGRFKTKTVYMVGRKKIPYSLGDPGFGTKNWRTVGGNPMVAVGFPNMDDFKRFSLGQIFWRYMNAVFGKDAKQLWAQNTIKRYQRAFIKSPNLVRIDRGARIWKLGFGRGFQRIWHQMISCVWGNTSYIMAVFPNTNDTVGGWTPFFVAGAGRVPGCGNGGWKWMAEGPEPKRPPDFPVAPPIPIEIPPIGLAWMYVGNNRASSDTRLHNPNVALQWTPATIIDIKNSLRQWQKQKSTNTNTNNNTWSNWNNWNNWNQWNNWNNWNNNNTLQNEVISMFQVPVVTAVRTIKKWMPN